jgi:hypothetical protein
VESAIRPAKTRSIADETIARTSLERIDLIGDQADRAHVLRPPSFGRGILDVIAANRAGS